MDSITLPDPPREGSVSLEQALGERRSVREFREEPLTLEQISRLLWALQGRNARGSRTAPSAGALYPLEIYVALADGMYHYEPRRHRLRGVADEDLRPAAFRAAHEQEFLLRAPALFVIAAVFERIAARYGPERTPRYVWMEVGHAAQNLLLEAAALGLGSVPVGAFDDQALHRALRLPPDQPPLYLLPVGYPL